MSLRRNAFIAVVQAAELRDLQDPSHTRDSPRKWTLLVEAQMGPRSVVISEIRSQGSLEMPGVQDDEMVQAVSSYGTDQAFGVWILPRTPGRGEYFFNMQGRDPQTNFFAVNGIPISYEIPRRLPIGEGLDDLLGSPCRSGMLGHIEMQHLPATMLLERLGVMLGFARGLLILAR